MQVQPLGSQGEAHGAPRVVVDNLGAGPGELVLVAHGSRCRDIAVGAEVAAKELTVAIVDDFAMSTGGET